ncbi:MAG: DUF4231 domain-containing protein [Pseudomonadota bacterium]
MSTGNTIPTAKPAWMSPIETRKERADYYFDTVLDEQAEWYSDSAGTQKHRYFGLAITVIVLGALISVLQAVETSDWVRYLTAALGAAVAVTRAIDTLLRPGETWHAYRKASESMKREYRLYLNNTDAYADAADEETAFRLLVERIETVIAEEQQLFWQFHAKSAAAQKTPPAPGEGG